MAKHVSFAGLTDEELFELGKRRFKNGKITLLALKAQEELWQREGCPFSRQQAMTSDGDRMDLDYYDSREY